MAAVAADEQPVVEQVDAQQDKENVVAAAEERQDHPLPQSNTTSVPEDAIELQKQELAKQEGATSAAGHMQRKKQRDANRVKWEPMYFAGDFEDSLGHMITSVEIPPRQPMGQNQRMPEPVFHAHFVAKGKPDKRFVISRKVVPRTQKRAWCCGNGFFCQPLSNPDKIVWRTEDGRENIWTRLPPAGPVFFDPPAGLTIDIEQAMAQWRAEHLQQLQEILNQDETQAEAPAEGEADAAATAGPNETTQAVAAGATEEATTAAAATAAVPENKKEASPAPAAAEVDAADAAGAGAGEAASRSRTPPAEEENKTETWADKIMGSLKKEAPSSSTAASKKSGKKNDSSKPAVADSKKKEAAEQAAKKPEERPVEEKSWGPAVKKWNVGAEEFFPPSLMHTRPRVANTPAAAKVMQARATMDPAAGCMFSELTWTLEEKWAQLRDNPQDFAIVSPNFTIGEIENMQMSFFPSGRKGSGKKHGHCSLQLLTGDLAQKGLGIELEISMNEIRCETAKKCVSKNFTGDYPRLDDAKTDLVKITLRVLNVFQDSKKIQN